jgi:hypothetical protein
MPALRIGDAGWVGRTRLLLVLFFVFFVFFILFEEVAVFRGFFFLVVIFFIEVIGDEVEMHGMRLRNLELGFALGTAPSSVAMFAGRAAPPQIVPPAPWRIIYRDVLSQL